MDGEGKEKGVSSDATRPGLNTATGGPHIVSRRGCVIIVITIKFVIAALAVDLQEYS